MSDAATPSRIADLKATLRIAQLDADDDTNPTWDDFEQALATVNALATPSAVVGTPNRRPCFTRSCERELGAMSDSAAQMCRCDQREVGPGIHPRCLACGGWIDPPASSAAENRYEVTVTRSRWGATADVGWYTDGVIGLQGPVFWRPTVRRVKRRADRHVARRLRMHARKAEVLRV